MAEQIRRELSDIVRDELKDPRMGLCSFTAVKLSRDLSHAIVFCTVLSVARAPKAGDGKPRGSALSKKSRSSGKKS